MRSNADETPIKDNKKSARRKLAAKTAGSKTNSPVAKKPRVKKADQQPKVIQQDKCVVLSSQPDTASDLSQEAGCTPLSGDLPPVVWQNTSATSPGFCIAESSKQRLQTSTPYKVTVWKESKANPQSSNFDSPDTQEYDGEAATKGDGLWLNEMLGLVSKLEENDSQDKLDVSTDISFTNIKPRSGTPIKHNYTIANSMTQSNQPMKPSRTPSIQKKAPSGNKSLGNNSTARLSNVNKTPSTVKQHDKSLDKSPDSFHKLDDNSLFGDSLGDFTSELLMCDEENSQKFGSKSQNVDDSSFELKSNAKESNRIKKELKTAVKSEVKTEPKTPSCNSRPQTKVTSGVLLRRHSSHDSLIKSPACKVSGENQDEPTPATAPPSNNQLSQADLIEKKRKDALNRLKNRRSGSFVRHRSLDSVTDGVTDSVTKSKPVSEKNGQEEGENVSMQNLKLIIEEKRREAAEKLQKHREEARENTDCLSGSLSQLTPPSSQENKISDHNKKYTNTIYSSSQNSTKSDTICTKSMVDELEQSSKVKTDITCDKPISSKSTTVDKTISYKSLLGEDKSNASQAPATVDIQKTIERKRLAALEKLKLSRQHIT